jgi:hypothetical protein
MANDASRADQLRVAAAEINGRRVNEAIERGTSQDTAVFTCECGNIGCNQTISMRISDYEAVRTDFDRFLSAPGHEIEAVDEVVERHPGYLVLRKLGAAADAARDTDPRADARSDDPAPD